MKFHLAIDIKSPDPLGKLKTVQQGSGLGDTPLPAVIASIITGLLSIVGILLITYLVYGGFVWMKSAGNEKEIEKAKGIITNSVIGLIIILAAYAISRFVICTALQATGATIC